MANNGQGFNDAYKLLQANAERLKRQEELDIDSLVPIVQKSAEAYQICKERIEAVRMALKAHLPPEEEN